MKFWRVTIKQTLPRKRYALHTVAVVAADADTAKVLARASMGAVWYDSVVAEPVEDGGVVPGRTSVHRGSI